MAKEVIPEILGTLREDDQQAIYQARKAHLEAQADPNRPLFGGARRRTYKALEAAIKTAAKHEGNALRNSSDPDKGNETKAIEARAEEAFIIKHLPEQMGVKRNPSVNDAKKALAALKPPI